MKKIILVFALVFSATAFSQIHEPVKWSTSVKKISDTEYKLISKATIEPGWHLYSQKVPEDGPLPTTFTYTNGKILLN
jgi:thiol:disulfide interchange protein DsbD